MDGVNNLIASSLELYHSKRQEIASRALNGRLEDTTANQLVSAPLASERVLGVDSNAKLLLSPWCGEQLELWPLPTNKAA